MFNGLNEKINIISLSLGVGRVFRVVPQRHAMKAGHRYKGNQDYLLRNGDLCVMEGRFQEFYKHMVPKSPASGGRINLTWRWIVKHKPQCPAHPQNCGSQ